MTPVIEPVAGARPVVELGVGDTRIPTGLGRWDISHWDTPGDTWAGTEPSWLDISCYVHEVEIEVGRDRSMQAWDVGSCTVTVNNETGWADMGQGPPPAPLALSVRPGRQLRVGIALDGGPTQWLWRGIIDDAEPTYDPEDNDVVTLAGIDAKGEAGKVDLGTVTPTVGAGETAATRIHRVLDAAGWSATARDIAPTAVTLLATAFGARAADLMDRAADSAGGAVFGDTRGMVVFKPRDWQTYDQDDPVEATIGNGGDYGPTDIYWHTDPVTFMDDPVIFGYVGAADVCPSRWERAFRRADIATRTVVGRPGQPTIQFDDTSNQILYGIETVERTDLEPVDDAQLEVLGERWLEVASADYMPRVAAVHIDAATSVAARNLAATVDPTKPSRYRCRHRRPDGTVVFDAQFLATGVQHRISRDGWECRIALDAAAPFASGGTRWDTGRWDEAFWSDVVFRLAELLSDVRKVTA